MEKKLLLIINPYAGRAAIRSYALDVIDTFVREGYLVTVCTTQKPGDPRRFVEELGEGFDRIVCCGGDGTVNECLNGVMTLKKPVEMGIIPAGVTNDYAYSLSVPSVPPRAAEVAAGGFPFKIDIGLFNDRYFAYVAGFGLFTEVTYQTDQEIKNTLGPFAYVIEVARRASPVFKTFHITLEHDNGVIEDDFLVGLFSNSISVAGLRTAYSDALLDDGMLEIALIRQPTKLEDYRDFVEVILNLETASTLDNDMLTVIHTSRAVVTCDEPMAWTVDGESGGMHDRAEITVRNQALTVIAGRDMRDNSVRSAPEEKGAGEQPAQKLI